MTSGSKMALFFLAATVFNLVVMAVLIGGFWLISILFSRIQWLSAVILFVGLMGSIVLTFMIYAWVMKKVTARFQLEKHIPQLFKGKRKN